MSKAIKGGMFACRGNSKSGRGIIRGHRNDSIKKEKQQIKKPRRLPEKDKRPIKSVPTLFSISTMENNLELRANKSCQNVNEADEELKVPSNVLMVSGMRRRDPPHTHTPSEWHHHKLDQLHSLGLSPPQVGGVAAAIFDRVSSFITPNNVPSARPPLLMNLRLPGSNCLLLLIFPPPPFVVWGDGCPVSSLRLWVASFIFVSLVSSRAFCFHAVKNSKIVHLTCTKASFCRKKIKAFKAWMLNWRVDVTNVSGMLGG